jgi:hypothetical protein
VEALECMVFFALRAIHSKFPRPRSGPPYSKAVFCSGGAGVRVTAAGVTRRNEGEDLGRRGATGAQAWPGRSTQNSFAFFDEPSPGKTLGASSAEYAKALSSPSPLRCRVLSLLAGLPRATEAAVSVHTARLRRLAVRKSLRRCSPADSSLPDPRQPLAD